MMANDAKGNIICRGDLNIVRNHKMDTSHEKNVNAPFRGIGIY